MDTYETNQVRDALLVMEAAAKEATLSLEEQRRKVENMPEGIEKNNELRKLALMEIEAREKARAAMEMKTYVKRRDVVEAVFKTEQSGEIAELDALAAKEKAKRDAKIAAREKARLAMMQQEDLAPEEPFSSYPDLAIERSVPYPVVLDAPALGPCSGNLVS